MFNTIRPRRPTPCRQQVECHMVDIPQIASSAAVSGKCNALSTVLSSIAPLHLIRSILNRLIAFVVCSRVCKSTHTHPRTHLPHPRHIQRTTLEWVHLHFCAHINCLLFAYPVANMRAYPAEAHLLIWFVYLLVCLFVCLLVNLWQAALLPTASNNTITTVLSQKQQATRRLEK